MLVEPCVLRFCMRENNTTIIFLNLFLTMLNVFVVLAFPTYLRTIEPVELLFKDVVVTFKQGRMESIVFEHNGNRYASLCRDLVDGRHHRLCPMLFHGRHHEQQEVSYIKADLVFKKFYKNENNILIIKELGKNHLSFVISKDGYEKGLQFWRHEKYFLIGMIIFSYVLLNGFYFRKSLKSKLGRSLG